MNQPHQNQRQTQGRMENASPSAQQEAMQDPEGSGLLRPGDPGYDAKRDPNSPEYDPNLDPNPQQKRR